MENRFLFFPATSALCRLNELIVISIFFLYENIFIGRAKQIFFQRRIHLDARNMDAISIHIDSTSR